MPYSVVEREGEFCVIKNDDGAEMGCHPSATAATQQVQALYASESKAAGIEIDALVKSWLEYRDSGEYPSPPPVTDHPPPELPPENIKTFIPAARSDTLLERFRSVFGAKSLHNTSHVFTGADGLRYMFLISSNSYKDREEETMTTKALDQYEASCFKGEGIFHCDNPLLWFHDPHVVMGTIEAVNHSVPFLIEIAKELPNDPVAQILWDFAERNGDNAGASIKFGYREDDRNVEGDYAHIFKVETSYLPERALAANIRTYAGVINDMSSPESDKRLNEIFKEATGGDIDNAAELLHTKSGEFKKLLEARGVRHKAKVPTDMGDIPDDAPPVEDAEAKAGFSPEFAKMLDFMSQMYGLVMQMTEGQEYLMETEMALQKSLKDMTEANAKEKAYSKTLEERVAILEKMAKLTPRRATQEAETDPAALAENLKRIQSEAANAELVDSRMFGRVKPPIKYEDGR